MRFVILAAALALTAAPALAQTAAPAPAAAPAAMTPAPAPVSGDAAPATKTHASRESLDKRFKAANTSNDGHLTKEQAEAAGNMKGVVKHFDAIDSEHKGYVTLEEIHKYNQARHAARRAKQQAKTEG